MLVVFLVTCKSGSLPEVMENDKSCSYSFTCQTFIVQWWHAAF